MQKKNIKISFIIVTFNNEDSIEKCMSSLLKNSPENSEIIIWDNASTDKTVNKLKTFKDIKVFESKQNLGYGRGNNLAVKQALGEYIFLLNPDTKVNSPIFDELIEFYKNDNNIGIIVPKLVMPDGTTQPSVKNLPTIQNAFEEYILGKKQAYSEFVPRDDLPIKVETAYGAAMLIKKDLFEKLKGFDEKYFLYYEDIDLCRRVGKLGKKIIYYPKALIIHYVGGSKSNQNRYNLNFTSSLKYHGFIQTALLQIIFRLHGLFTK